MRSPSMRPSPSSAPHSTDEQDSLSRRLGTTIALVEATTQITALGSCNPEQRLLARMYTTFYNNSSHGEMLPGVELAAKCLKQHCDVWLALSAVSAQPSEPSRMHAHICARACADHRMHGIARACHDPVAR